jgi:hypothetical protein
MNTGGRRRSRKMRGGNGYGVGQPIAVGALEYVPNMTSVPDGAAYKPTGGRRSTRTSMVRRRRTTKRGGKHRRGHKSRTRKMRGGGSVANVGYSFTGDGARGLANHSAYPSNLPPGGDFEIPTGTR